MGQSLLMIAKSGTGKPPDWHVSMFGIHLQIILWVYCTVLSLDMLESKGMTEETDWRAKQPSHASCVSEDVKC